MALPPLPLPRSARPGGYPSNNPLGDFFGSSRGANALIALGSGLMSGKSWADGLAQGGQGFIQGAQIDDAYATSKKEEAERQRQITETANYLRQQGGTQYADWIDRGLVDPKTAFNKWYEQTQGGGAAQDETFFAPIAGMVGDQPSFVQFGNRGSVKAPEGLPEGFRPQSRYDKRDLGTHLRITDTVTGETWDEPKNNEEAAYQSAFGGEAGKAAAQRIEQLPGLMAKTDNMVSTIDGILNDPALDASTGWLSWMQGVWGTDQYRFGQRALQLQGQAFLQAFESLKGGGQITEIEGIKATQAIGRLSTAQKPEDYRDALEELKGIIQSAKSRAVQGASPGGTDMKTKYGLE